VDVQRSYRLKRSQKKEFVLIPKSLVFAALVLLLAGCGGGDAASAGGEETLEVGLIPNQNPEEVEAQYQPLEDYLSEELGREVVVSVPTTYNAVVEAMVSDKLDLAYFGGLTYVQARQRADVHPLFTEINPRTGTTEYRSFIIVPADSDVREVADLNGETFAFGSVSSTSGSLYPSIMLEEAGIDYRTDLEEVIYTGGHDTTAQAVANGRVDAGGLEGRILLDLQEEGVIEEDSVRVIERSAPIEGYPWVVRDDLPDETEEQLTDAFLGIEDPELLDLLRADGYETVSAEDYDYVEEQARKLDLLAEEQ
jgi:phosphonate transport system substrate-binding protein